MGYYSGNSGNIQFRNAASGSGVFQDTITKITNWTLTTSAQLLDTTTLGDYDKTSVYGLRTTSGTLKMFYYTADGASHSAPSNNSASWFISNFVRTASQDDLSIEVRLRLYIDDKQMTGSLNEMDYIELDANLTSVSYGSNVGELVSVDISFEANGAVIANEV